MLSDLALDLATKVTLFSRISKLMPFGMRISTTEAEVFKSSIPEGRTAVKEDLTVSRA